MCIRDSLDGLGERPHLGAFEEVALPHGVDLGPLVERREVPVQGPGAVSVGAALKPRTGRTDKIREGCFHQLAP